MTYDLHALLLDHGYGLMFLAQDVMILWMKAHMCSVCLWCNVILLSRFLGVFPLYFLCLCSLGVYELQALNICTSSGS
jgi:hypothetical protein